MNWNSVSVFIFDLDGCIYSGNKVYEGSRELITFLLNEKKQVVFLSNNSTDHSETIRQKLCKMGLPAEHASIFVATELIGSYLFEQYGQLRVLPIGTDQLKASLRKQGHRTQLLDHENHYDFVVVGRDPDFSYNKLNECVRNVMNGAKLIATNLDLFHPGEDGYRVPETGALIAAIQAVSGEEDVPFVGKPSIYPFDKIKQKLDSDLENFVMIGDNPYTDMQGAHAEGLKTIWISLGHTFPEELDFQPDLSCNSMKELADILIDSISSGKGIFS